MIFQTLIAVILILAVLAGWIFVQHLARAFAARHPELGPAREEGEGCGGLLCLCKNKDHCPKYLLIIKQGSTAPSKKSGSDSSKTLNI